LARIAQKNCSTGIVRLSLRDIRAIYPLTKKNHAVFRYYWFCSIISGRES
jgi:hypothetical protein